MEIETLTIKSMLSLLTSEKEKELFNYIVTKTHIYSMNGSTLKMLIAVRGGKLHMTNLPIANSTPPFFYLKKQMNIIY